MASEDIELTLGIDASDVGKEMEEAAKESTERSKQHYESFASSVKGIMAGVGAALSISALSSLADESVETSRAMSRLDTAAQANNISTEAMKQNYLSLVGVVGDTDRANEALSDSMNLCAGNQETLEQFTHSLTGAYARFGDAMPLESLAEAANETAKTATVTGSFADALNWVSAAEVDSALATTSNADAAQAYADARAQGMTAEDAFNEALAACNDEQERSQLVTETMNGLYSESASQYNEATGGAQAYAQAQEEMKLALAEAGEALTPFLTNLIGIGTAIVENVVPYMGQLFDYLSQLGNDVLPIVSAAGQWFIDNLPIIAPFLAAIAAVITTITVATTLQTAATTAWTAAQGLLNAVLNANPLAIVAVLLIALVAAFVTAYNSSEDFRNVVNSAFEAVSGFVSSVVSALVNFFTVTVPGAISDMINWFANIPGNVSNFLGNAINAAWDFVSSMGNAAANAASSFADNIWNGLQWLGSSVVNIGQNIVYGIWDGISGLAGWLWDSVSNFASGILDSAMSALGIHSPSRKFRDMVGKNIARGIKVGYELEDPMNDIGDSLSKGVRAIDVQGSTASAISRQDVQQTINFNVPTATPDVVAREMSRYSHYGLSGSY